MIEVREVPLERILPPSTPRVKDPKGKDIRELAESIDENGLVKPILLNRNSPRKGYLRITDGERRYYAFLLKREEKLDYGTIPAMIRPMSDKMDTLLSIIANDHRLGFTPQERVKKIIDAYKNGDYDSVAELARLIQVSESTVRIALAIDKLTPEIKNGFYAEKINYDHARAICTIKKAFDRLKLYRRILREKLTPDKTWEIVKPTTGPLRKTYRSLDIAAGKLEDPSSLQVKHGSEHGYTTIKFTDNATLKKICKHIIQHLD